MITATNVIGAILILVLGGVFAQIKFNGIKMKKALYKDDGTTVYVPRAEWGPTYETICKKIEEVKSVAVKADEKRQDARVELSEKLEGIQFILGGIEEYMEKHP